HAQGDEEIHREEMSRQRQAMMIGVISDTHGLMRPQALAALEGCAHILHAGDIGAPEILQALENIAPLTVIRGNNDEHEAWARDLPDDVELALGGQRLYMLHSLKMLGFDPAARNVDVV